MEIMYSIKAQYFYIYCLSEQQRECTQALQFNSLWKEKMV
jgi:hypothetical protein